MFKKIEINKIIKSKNIYLIGRGLTTKHIKFGQKGIYYIGYRNSKNVDLNIDRKDIIKSKFKLKVGSVYFGLYSILKELDLIFFKKKKVYLFGFDFRKYSTDEDFQGKESKNVSILQQIIDIGSQRFAYANIKNRFKNLEIIRSGYDFDSDISPKNFVNNKKKINNLNIVAEITTNHQGDNDRLIKLIEGVINANCKTLKFQKRHVESFYPSKILCKEYKTPISKNFFEYRKKLELNKEQLEIIKFYRKKNDLNIIFSALDYLSYKELRKEGFNFFKIPSTISNYTKFINYISNQKLNKIIISTGMTNQKYVNNILKKFKKFKKIYLLHAISSYPTSYKDMNLKILENYVELSKTRKNIIPGYSSHDPGFYGCMLAVAMGARMIEKHIKFGNSDWMHYDDTALDINYEFPNFIEKLNKSYTCLGSKSKKILNVEHHKYSFK